MSEASRQLLLAMLACGAPTALSRLEEDFEAFYGHRSRSFGWVRGTTDFTRSLNELEGNFIRISEGKDEPLVHWHNPSVLDFLHSWVKRHSRDVEDLLRVATRFDQVERLAAAALLSMKPADIGRRIRFDEGVLADALRRTTSGGQADWLELLLALRLCEVFVRGTVRILIKSRLDGAFGSLASSRAGCPVVVRVLNSAARQDWIDARHLGKWRGQLKRRILTLGDRCASQIDQFVDVSTWVSENRDDFADDEYRGFLGHAARFVESEANASIWPNTKDIWISIRDDVERLGTVLGISFDSAIRTIEQNIESADTPDEQQECASECAVPASESVSIGSMFDSLLG